MGDPMLGRQVLTEARRIRRRVRRLQRQRCTFEQQPGQFQHEPRLERRRNEPRWNQPRWRPQEVSIMKTTKTVSSVSMSRRFPSVSSLILSCGIFCVVLLTVATSSQGQSASAKPMVFGTAESPAADALIAAAEHYDEAALAEILGPDSYDLIHNGEPGRDRNTMMEFAEQARIKTVISKDPKRSGRAFILVGIDDWPGPHTDRQAGKGLVFRRGSGTSGTFI